MKLTVFRYFQVSVWLIYNFTEGVLKYADYIGSTSGIIDYVVDTDCEEFIIATVDGVFGEIRKKAPGKKLYTLKPDQVCVNMKMVTLDKVLDVLEQENNEVFVDEEVAKKAMKPPHPDGCKRER